MFVVASKHELIPLIYASRQISNDGLTCSGPAYVSTRSLPFLKQNAANLKPIRVFTRDEHDGLLNSQQHEEL